MRRFDLFIILVVWGDINNYMDVNDYKDTENYRFESDEMLPLEKLVGDEGHSELGRGAAHPRKLLNINSLS